MKTYLDIGSWFVALLTLALFTAALFVKGLTHDLFLEGGVFLVSVKIIAMAYRNSLEVRALGEKVDRVLAALEKEAKGSDGPGTTSCAR